MPARWYYTQLICWGQVMVGVERVLNARHRNTSGMDDWCSELVGRMSAKSIVTPGTNTSYTVT